LRRVPIIAAAIVAQFLVTALAHGADEPGELGDRVVAFCKEHKGKRVGNGECTSLVMAALLSAGAKPHGFGDHRRTPPKRGEFNWGELVYTLERSGGGDLKWTGKFENVRPGDIVQFKDVELAGKTDTGTYTARAQHHSAVVSGVNKDEGILRIYHQNYNGHKAVMPDLVRLADLQVGRFQIYHPLPATR
jgi:hypothetical protein